MTTIESARIAFAGTPDFAVPCLQALIAAGAAIESAWTQPDRPAGRGRKLTESPVKQLARSHGIPVQQPARLDAGVQAELSARRPQILVVVAYGLILPQWMLDWAQVAAVNVHASLLPRWRGASPIHQAILAGDATTGVSLMRMTAGLDSGPIYRQRATPVAPTETAGELHDRLAVLGAELLIETLPEILRGAVTPVPQDESGACYAPKIAKREAALDWTQSAVQLERRVRAFNPWPVAEGRTGAGQRLRIWQANAVAADAQAPPGSVVATAPDGIDVATGDGILRLSCVQPPGGRPMRAAAYLAAHDLDGASFVGPGR
jgi:methionyl-tRNA formyltransferase